MTKILYLIRMQMIKLGKGSSSGKDFWLQFGNSDHRHRHRLRIPANANRKRLGCCARIRMYEENARFALLIIFMFLYLSMGAVIFQFIERDQEILERRQYIERVGTFKRKYCKNLTDSTKPTKRPNSAPKSTRRSIDRYRMDYYRQPRVNCSELDDLLDLRGNLSAAGLMSPRLKWDWSGSFYFVGTVVSTIGYGMTTPRTTTGKALVIIYGFFGCAGAILLFNLFLERVITLFAHILRYIHNKREKRLLKRHNSNTSKPAIRIIDTTDSDSNSESSVEQWRPSVYMVMACLFLLSSILILCAAFMYKNMENWTFFESIYFCFISFATIGFGDYVSSQQESNDSHGIIWYRAANFLFLTLGCCCIYSLFNVTSIIIRQFLNRLIRAMDCHLERPRWLRRKQRPYLGLGLRPPKNYDQNLDSDSECGSPSRRTSNDGNNIMSLKEFLEQNKMNLYLMQKHLIESAHQRLQDNHFDTSTAISATSVGPLAILTKKFGEN